MTYRWVDEKRLRIAQLVLLGVGVSWGIDYLITPDDQIAAALTVVERAFPIYVWGYAFLTFGIIGYLGELWMEIAAHHPALAQPHTPMPFRTENRWWPSFTAHCALLALYAAVGAGYAIELVINHHLYGFRAPVLMWAFAVGHWVFMKRRQNA